MVTKMRNPQMRKPQKGTGSQRTEKGKGHPGSVTAQQKLNKGKCRFRKQIDC
jgi:hypothetical protein